MVIIVCKCGQTVASSLEARYKNPRKWQKRVNAAIVKGSKVVEIPDRLELLCICACEQNPLLEWLR